MVFNWLLHPPAGVRASAEKKVGSIGRPIQLNRLWRRPRVGIFSRRPGANSPVRGVVVRVCGAHGTDQGVKRGGIGWTSGSGVKPALNRFGLSRFVPAAPTRAGHTLA